MSEVSSTFDTIVVEFTETTNWITSKVSCIKASSDNELLTIDAKIRTLLPMIEKYDRSFRSVKVQLSDEIILPLERAATNLWNKVSILSKVETKRETNVTLFNCKLFASLLLALHEAISADVKSKIRSFKCFLKTLKFSIDTGLSEVQKKIQNHCDKCFQMLEQYFNSDISISKQTIISYKRLRIEMFVTNLQQSVDDKDLKMGRFFENKAQIEENLDVLDADIVIEVCRVIYNSTLNLFQCESGKSFTADIVYFLERLICFLGLDVENLKSHPEFAQLKYTIILFLANVLICDGTDKETCNKYLNRLQNEYHKKVEPYKLALKFHELEKPFPVKTTEDILMQMMMSVNLESHFDSTIGCINHQAKRDTSSALRCLDYIFYNKLKSDINHDFLERLLTTRVYIVSQSSILSNEDKIKDLKQFVSSFERVLTKKLSKTCTSSVITLLFNSGKILYKKGNPTQSIDWFLLALNNLLSAKYIDKGKVQRALQFAYLDTSNYDAVQKTFEEMNLNDRNNVLTQLIMFRVFLHNQNDNAIKDCLDNIKNSTDSRSLDILILAISECKRSTDLAVYGMMSMFEKLRCMETSIGESRGGSIICSLRYTIQMIVKMTEGNDSGELENYLPVVQSLFKSGLDFLETIKTLNQLSGKISKDPAYDETISIFDIEWFASSCYNLSRKLVSTETAQNVESLLETSLSYLRLIPQAELNADQIRYYIYWKYRILLLKQLFLRSQCNWSGLMGQTRSLIEEFEISFPEYDDVSKSNPLSSDIAETLKELIILHFEATSRLADMESLQEILYKTGKKFKPEIDVIFFNILMSLETPPPSVYSMKVMGSLIERNIGNANFSNSTLIIWMRAFFEVGLPQNEQACLSVLTQFQNRAKFSSTKYSCNEIEWLTTCVWNHGVSNIISNNKSQGITWCKKALELSKLCSDDDVQLQLEEFWVALASSADLTNASLHD